MKEGITMEKANGIVRKAIKNAGLTYWQVAEEVGIASTTLSVWLRTPLNSSRMSRVNNALKELKKGAAVNA